MPFAILCLEPAWFSDDGIILNSDRLPTHPHGGTLPWASVRRIAWITCLDPFLESDSVAVELDSGYHLWFHASEGERWDAWNRVLAAHFPGASRIRGLVARHLCGGIGSEILWPPEQAEKPLYGLRSERRWWLFRRRVLAPMQ